MMWPVIAVGFLAITLAPQVLLHAKDQTIAVDVVGVPVVLGAVFLRPSDLALAVLAGSLIASLVQRKTPERLLFNVCNHMWLAGASLAVLDGVMGRSLPISFAGWLGIALALLAGDLATIPTTVGVVTVSSAAPGWKYIRTIAYHDVLYWPVSAVLGIVAVTLAWTQRWALLLLVGAAILLAMWYRSTNKVKARYANLQLLYGFTVKLAGLSETDEVIEAALGEARRLLACKDAQLSLRVGAHAERFGLDEAGLLLRTYGDLTPFEISVIDEGTARIGTGAATDVIAAPVQLGDLGTAALIVGDHIAELDSFDPEELGLFEALAANLSTALTSSHRLDRLRQEVSNREHEALHDSLTGLANRTLFAQWVSQALEKRRPDQMVAVMLMDLDGFKDINDTLGHHTGDTILKEVSGRVLAAIGSNRLAARLGGDEFAFVVPGVGSMDEVISIANSILEAVSRPVPIEDTLVLELRASLGVSVAPQDGQDQASLLQRADVAMYSAKATKRGVVVYDREIDQNTKRRLILATELRRAMDHKELEVWYQPVARMDTGEVCGLEALLRWRHSIYGSISPNEFIPVAEQTALIEPLTWWVLETALTELQRWRDEGYDLTMAVNVSARSLLGPEIVERLGRILRDVGVPPSSVILEITESLMMVDPDWSERILTDLAGLGVNIAIDDFGTGYSSLSRLKRLPVQMVKVDRSFVMNMHIDPNDAAIVRATIDLARTMGHSVVAEGVEQQATWDQLRELGCDHVQGYLLAAAMPVSECRPWLLHRQPRGMAPVRHLPTIARGA